MRPQLPPRLPTAKSKSIRHTQRASPHRDSAGRRVFMSANTIWRSAPVSVLAAFALGAAAAAGRGAALPALMAARGFSPVAPAPFAAASVCEGGLLGGWVLALLQKSWGLPWGGGMVLAYALALLGFQLAGGGVQDGAQLARLPLVVLSGAAGGSAGARRTEKRRRR